MFDLFWLLRTGEDRRVLSSALLGIKMQKRLGREAGSDLILLYLAEGGLEECSSVKKKNLIYSLLPVRALVSTGVFKFPSFLAVAAFTEPNCSGAGVGAHVRMALAPSSLFRVHCSLLVLPRT